MALILVGVFMMAMGAYYIKADLDALWEGYERRARARGIVNLQRTPEWERSKRSTGWGLVVGGLFLAVLAAWAFDMSSKRPRVEFGASNSASSQVDGRKVTEQEGESTGLKAE